MLRRIGPGWIQIIAHRSNIGATLNAEHVVAVRFQPEVNQQDQEPTGRFNVFIDLVTGQTHALTLDTYEEAREEYDRLANELLGETVQ